MSWLHVHFCLDELEILHASPKHEVSQVLLRVLHLWRISAQDFGIQVFPLSLCTERGPKCHLQEIKPEAFTMLNQISSSLSSSASFYHHNLPGVSRFFSGKPCQILRNTEFKFRQTCISICPPLLVTYVNSEELLSPSEALFFSFLSRDNYNLLRWKGWGAWWCED